jgi:hypothetical protein
VAVVEGDDDDVEEGGGGVKQYRLEATRKVRRSVTSTFSIFFTSLTFVINNGDKANLSSAPLLLPLQRRWCDSQLWCHAQSSNCSFLALDV